MQMSRQAAVLAAVSVLIGSSLNAESRSVVLPSQRTIKYITTDFGAVGNGIADDYAALKKAADYLSKNQHIELRFPVGTYKIDRVRNLALKDQPSHLIYRECHDVHIVGEKGAVISVKGDFIQEARSDVSDADKIRNIERPAVEQIIPFYFFKCSNFSVSNIELNGNVDKMERPSKVVAGGGGVGILTRASTDYLLSNLFIHHFSLDGLLLGMDPFIADKRVSLSKVKSSNNARQALSIIQVRNANIYDSAFTDSGRTGVSPGVKNDWVNPKYRGHSPMAGVDIEPEYMKKVDPVTGALGSGVDQNTAFIRFVRCSFLNNIGAQIVGAVPIGTSDVDIFESNLVASDTDSTKFVIGLGIMRARLERNYIYLGRGSIYPDYKTNFRQSPSSALLVNNNIVAKSGEGIVTTESNSVVTLHKNRIVGRHSTALEAGKFFPNLQNAKIEYVGNLLFYPPALSSNAETTNVGFIENAATLSGNQYCIPLKGVGPLTISHRNSARPASVPPTQCECNKIQLGFKCETPISP
jgi:hypothetical protein